MCYLSVARSGWRVTKAEVLKLHSLQFQGSEFEISEIKRPFVSALTNSVLLQPYKGFHLSCALALPIKNTQVNVF